MGFTARQFEMVEILKSGVAFLESQPKKEKYSLRDIMTAAGDEIHAANLYGLIKQLKKKKARMELAQLREIFARLNVQVGPLEVDDKPEMSVMEPEADNLVLEAATSNSMQDFGSVPNDEPVRESAPLEPDSMVKVKIDPPSFENEITSLSIVLRTLAPLTRDMRMNVLSAAESFYGIGH